LKTETDRSSNERANRAYLVGPFCSPYRTRDQAESGLRELDGLCRAAGIVPVGAEVVAIHSPNPAFYLGTGQTDRIIEHARDIDALVIVFDEPLSPVHLRNWARRAGTEVYDRHAIILEIFSRRARSKEAQLQVELARARYAQSHLVGMWQHLSRQGGGSRLARGEGEKQLEMDRRALAQRVKRARHGLEHVARHRERSRNARADLFRVALVGYTNAGKSSLLNALVNARLRAANQLFATLDPSTRRLKTDADTTVLFSDTVGFVSRLPPELIDAFHSTLEEAVEADLLLLVLDAADPAMRDHLATTLDILHRIGAEGAERLFVLNKCDRLGSDDSPDEAIRDILRPQEATIRCSARDGDGIRELRDLILRRARA